MSQIDLEYLLKRLEYNPKSVIIEKKIINYVLKNIKESKWEKIVILM